MSSIRSAFLKQEIEKIKMLLEALGFTIDEDESGYDKLSLTETTTYIHPEGFEIVITESFNTE